MFREVGGGAVPRSGAAGGGDAEKVDPFSRGLGNAIYIADERACGAVSGIC